MKGINMQYRHRIAPHWQLLGLLVLLLPLIAACGGQDTTPASTGGQQATQPTPETPAARIVPVEGQAFSGQDRATRPNTPVLLAFDALG
ncbi:MAG: hypothetical protein M3506_05620 [Chloroflexota bacterium]|nr:hypothetical protein [Chloroflexota bacterium]